MTWDSYLTGSVGLMCPDALGNIDEASGRVSPARVITAAPMAEGSSQNARVAGGG
jgi:hypothetical protein